MELWRKKENHKVFVEAVRLDEDNVKDVAVWSSSELVEQINPEHRDEVQLALNVLTPAGIRRATLGMYVLKFGKHFYISYVRPFEEVYEPTTRPADHPESAGDSRKARGFADPFDRGRTQ